MNYPKLGEVREGDVLIADDGFDCLYDGQRCVVKRNDEGDLYVDCAEGTHALDGQLNEHDEYVGFTR